MHMCVYIYDFPLSSPFHIVFAYFCMFCRYVNSVKLEVEYSMLFHSVEELDCN